MTATKSSSRKEASWSNNELQMKAIRGGGGQLTLLLNVLSPEFSNAQHVDPSQ